MDFAHFHMKEVCHDAGRLKASFWKLLASHSLPRPTPSPIAVQKPSQDGVTSVGSRGLCELLTGIEVAFFLQPEKLPFWALRGA